MGRCLPVSGRDGGFRARSSSRCRPRCRPSGSGWVRTGGGGRSGKEPAGAGAGRVGVEQALQGRSPGTGPGVRIWRRRRRDGVETERDRRRISAGCHCVSPTASAAREMQWRPLLPLGCCLARARAVSACALLDSTRRRRLAARLRPLSSASKSRGGSGDGAVAAAHTRSQPTRSNQRHHLERLRRRRRRRRLGGSRGGGCSARGGTAADLEAPRQTYRLIRSFIGRRCRRSLAAANQRSAHSWQGAEIDGLPLWVEMPPPLPTWRRLGSWECCGERSLAIYDVYVFKRPMKASRNSSPGVAPHCVSTLPQVQLLGCGIFCPTSVLIVF